MSEFHERHHEWACPRCNADANACGVQKKADGGHPDGQCMGFICECANEGDTSHGELLSQACPEARCYHCGWTGSFPAQPKGMLAWEKKAWEAGWAPPRERALELGLAAINLGE